MFTKKIADKVCARLATGESLRSICRDPGFPAHSTVLTWARENEEFANQYTRARELQAHSLADEIIEISNTPVVGVKRKTNEKGETEETEGDMIEHRRLQVDARKWYLSKVLPKVYGDKIDLNHSGRIATSREMSEEELASIAAGSSR